MSVVKNKNGRGILLAMVHAIQQNKQLLGDVDGLIGDGDHGMNMNKGFTLYEEQLGDQDTSLSDGLFDLGSVLLNKIRRVHGADIRHHFHGNVLCHRRC